MKKGLGTCLKTDFSMAVNYYFVFFIIALVVGVFAYNTTKDILVIPFLLVGAFTVGRLWKVLMWDTISGEGASLHLTLPVSPAAFAFSKIFTAGFSLALFLTFLVPAFMVPAFRMGTDLYRDAEWINTVNGWILNWKQMYGFTPEGIGRILTGTWGPAFLLAALAYIIIALIGKRNHDN